MVFKLNISQKGKAWKLELDSEILVGKKIGDKIPGKEISPDLNGYELGLTGASDFAGFPHSPKIEGPDKKRVLLTKGFGMHKKPRKEGKRKTSTPRGLRLRKSLRGSQISEKTIQINLNVLKEGSKKLTDIFPEQNKSKEAPTETPKESSSDTSTSTPSQSTPSQPTTDQVTDKKSSESTKQKIEKEIKEEVAEEIREDIPTSEETKTSKAKEDAAEKVAEEVSEQLEKVEEKIAKEENK
jgi:ribosomal protein S6E (S10)